MLGIWGKHDIKPEGYDESQSTDADAYMSLWSCDGYLSSDIDHLAQILTTGSHWLKSVEV